MLSTFGKETKRSLWSSSNFPCPWRFFSKFQQFAKSSETKVWRFSHKLIIHGQDFYTIFRNVRATKTYILQKLKFMTENMNFEQIFSCQKTFCISQVHIEQNGLSIENFQIFFRTVDTPLRCSQSSQEKPIRFEISLRKPISNNLFNQIKNQKQNNWSFTSVISNTGVGWFISTVKKPTKVVWTPGNRSEGGEMAPIMKFNVFFEEVFAGTQP